MSKWCGVVLHNVSTKQSRKPIPFNLTLHIEYGYSKRFTEPLRQRESFLGAFRPNIRLPSIGKPGFRFWNPDFRFCNRTRSPVSDFTFEKSVLRVDFNLEIQIRISWISSLPFDWEIQNWNDLQNCSREQRSFLLTMRARARPLFLRTVCFKSLFGFPNWTVKRKSKNRFLSVKIRFWISRSIANPKSGF